MSFSSRMPALALAFGLIATGPALAEPCGADSQPSPASHDAASIQFWNGTDFPNDVLWSDFRGGLKSYGSLSPDEGKDQQTYAGHVWYVEVDTPQGRQCVGPVAVSRRGGECQVFIKRAGGRFTMKAQGDCEF
ncbi:hypothetical protein [Methyloraptor flagellatus]|uniref:von Hippel-Lindau disease tumour suppressor beta domain-containing protein n=1 Tax=Methyloraptor flagellatus TaxID=3162530 RepID=A0AAU7XA91_9HYPH